MPQTDRLAQAQLFTAAQAGDERALDTLCRRYMALARSLALRMTARGEQADDLMQVACVGLVSAIRRFDPAREVAFSSFAVPTILGELRRHFRDHGWAIRPPRRVQERWLELNAARARLGADSGREPTVDELASEIGCPAEDILEALEAARVHVIGSLDEPLGAEAEASSVGELTGAEDDGYAAVDARVTLRWASGRLTSRQRAVVWLHAGNDLTQDEIANVVGVSQMQVSRDLRAAREALVGAFD